MGPAVVRGHGRSRIGGCCGLRSNDCFDTFEYAHQQELVDKQLSGQREDAARSREKEAMAELLGAASSFLFTSDSTDVETAKQRSSIFVAASYRWTLEVGDAD